MLPKEPPVSFKSSIKGFPSDIRSDLYNREKSLVDTYPLGLPPFGGPVQI